MKPLILACLIASSPLGAQKITAADSAAITKAAIGRDSAGVMYLEIIRDTAWVVGSTLRVTVDTTWTKDSPNPTIAWGNVFDEWEARVERRRGTWVRVSRRAEKSR